MKFLASIACPLLMLCSCQFLPSAIADLQILEEVVEKEESAKLAKEKK